MMPSRGGVVASASSETSTIHMDAGHLVVSLAGCETPGMFSEDE